MYAGIPNTATYNFTESKGRRDELRGFKLKRARCMEASIYENFHLWLQFVQVTNVVIGSSALRVWAWR